MNEDEGVFSHILICKNMEKALEVLQERFVSCRHLFYQKDEFLLDDAKEVIKEAYIAESHKKYLIIMAKGYRVEAQNALLKMLGGRVMARAFELQATELHVRVALLNSLTQLGRPATVPVPAVA